MKTILIVEAVAWHRELLGEWLKDDYAVFAAADGTAGLTLAEQTRPDLIFMALALPDLDGSEVARRLKAQVQLRDIPIIALTAQAMPDADTAAWGADYADALCTPLEEDLVEATIRKWLGGG